MSKRYDLVIVGTGTAAMVAAMRVRAAGWRVAVIDFRPFGGTCALRGCDPKKMLIAGAETADGVGRMRGRGVAGDVRIDTSWCAAISATVFSPRVASNATRALNAAEWFRLGFFMDFFPPFTLVPGQKSTYTRF